MEKEVPPIIKWDRAWTVGVKELDAAHKKLADIIQSVFAAAMTAKGVDYIEGVVDELIQYTRYHFTREENLLREQGYEHQEGQEQEHNKLLKDVIEIGNRIKAEGASMEISDELYKLLKNWLVTHILDEDMLYQSLLCPV